jgi:hypothetical protein
MNRRRFNHFVTELSLLLDRRLERFALWQAVSEAGYDPERWSGAEAERFCAIDLPRWLRSRGLPVAEHRLARLGGRMRSYDPSLLTPEEHFARLGS